MGSGEATDGIQTIDGSDWTVPWDNARDEPSGDCTKMWNSKWYAVKVYVGNSTTIDDATFCGYVSSETTYTENDLFLGSEDTLMDLMKLGGSVKCPETVGSSQYVILYFSNPYAY